MATRVKTKLQIANGLKKIEQSRSKFLASFPVLGATLQPTDFNSRGFSHGRTKGNYKQTNHPHLNHTHLASFLGEPYPMYHFSSPGRTDPSWTVCGTVVAHRFKSLVITMRPKDQANWNFRMSPDSFLCFLGYNLAPWNCTLTSTETRNGYQSSKCFRQTVTRDDAEIRWDERGRHASSRCSLDFTGARIRTLASGMLRDKWKSIEPTAVSKNLGVNGGEKKVFARPFSLSLESTARHHHRRCSLRGTRLPLP